MHVSQEISKRGFFFMPESPEKKYPGLLTISDGGIIELEITSEGQAFNEFNEFEIGTLIGLLENGYVTIEGCSYRKRNLSFGESAATSLIHGRTAFFGVGMIQPAKFKAIKFSLDGLSEWLGRPALKITNTFEDWSATLEKHSPIHCNLPLNLSLKIDIKTKLPLHINYPITELHQHSYIEINSDTPQDFEFFQSVMFKVSRFFSFLIGQSVSIYSVSAHIEDENIDKHYRWLDVYFKSRNKSILEKKVFHEMLISYYSINSRLETVLYNWLAEYENLTPAIHLYFAAQDDSFGFLDTKFTGIANALEAFHRRTRPHSTTWTENEYEAKLEAILKSCPETEREWLGAKLKFGNEISLSKRLKELIAPFKSVFGNSSTKKSLVNLTVGTRNYYAHLDPAGKERAAQGAKLIALTFRLRVLFALSMLHKLGFSESETIDLAKSPALNKLLSSASFIDSQV